MNLLGIVNGFDIYEENGCVWFTSPTTIDADGANGQNGQEVAYKNDDKGLDSLSSVGLAIVEGQVKCVKDWARNCVILGADNEPHIFPGGLIASTTWYRDRTKLASDPNAYVDATTVKYIVVPPLIVQRTAGVVRGCKATVTYGERQIECVVADLGPGNHLGEISIAAAIALGIPSNARHGGIDEAVVKFQLWPGTPAPGFELQHA